MPGTPIRRDDLGAGPTKKVTGGNFSGKLLTDVDGKAVQFEDCTFSASIIERGYFHKAAFRGCKFVGTRFVDSVFRSSTFEHCDFSYAVFQRCHLPIPQLLANLPSHANVRWQLLRNLRANQRETGDSQHDSAIVWREIDAEMEHWRGLRASASVYYQKYTSRDRALALWNLFRLRVERHVWGHGESLWRLFLATGTLLVILALCRAIGLIHSADATSLSTAADKFLSSLSVLGALYVDLPSVVPADVQVSPITSCLAVALRYVSIGLAVPVLYKYIAKR
jgi:hypothetical protein